MVSELSADGVADVPPLPDLNDPDIGNMSKTEREMHVETLKKRQAWLASTFRNRMTSGQSFGIANKYRIAFYDDVLQLANEVSFHLYSFLFCSEVNHNFFSSLRNAVNWFLMKITIRVAVNGTLMTIERGW